MKRKTLSIMPYFGGKNRMAHYITDRLNYDDSDVFIDVFGGAGNIILNKPRHKIEIYNDYADGVVSIMNMLSDPEKSRTFIYRLLETEYSEEEFNEAKKIVDIVETDIVEYYGRELRRELKKLLKKYKIISERASQKKIDNMLENELEIDKLIESLKGDTSFDEIEVLMNLYKLKDNYEKAKHVKEEQGYIERTRDLGIDISDIDLAVSTYVVNTQSRDGMGEVWSQSKFKSTTHYRDSMAKLFDCAERLEGINIYQMDAMDFFRWYLGSDMDNVLEASKSDYAIMNRWIHDPKVMFYCDPSYISPQGEEIKLEGIDWENEENLSEVIKKRDKKIFEELCKSTFKNMYRKDLDKFYKRNIKDKDKKKILKVELKEKFKEKFKKKLVDMKWDFQYEKMPKNLGKVYVKSSEYEEHEQFLKCICNADAKFMVSNYDLKLYNKYLSLENGWKRVEFETFTSIGNKADNKRVEVLWMNY